jgi:hypothetical protein
MAVFGVAVATQGEAWGATRNCVTAAADCWEQRQPGDNDGHEHEEIELEFERARRRVGKCGARVWGWSATSRWGHRVAACGAGGPDTGTHGG